MSLAPEGYEAPTHHVQAALDGPLIKADDRMRVGRSYVPTGGCWGGPLRRDRENELDLAHIGGEAHAATHGASIAGPGRRPKRSPLHLLHVRSFDHLVGAGKDRGWHGEAKRLGGLQVDDQLEFCWLLDRQIGRLGAMEDFSGVNP
jgi:hypothetical protein